MQIQCEEALENIPRLPFSADVMDLALKTEETNELVEIIYRDISVTMKVLSAANSAAVRRSGPETVAVKRALLLIGFNRARAILLAAIYSSALDTRLCPSFDDKSFWKDAALLGFAAQGIAQVTNHPCEEIRSGAMSAGLLSKVGLLFLAHYYPEEVNKTFFLYENEKEKWGSLHACIQSTMKVDYGKLGTRILQQWNLPSSLSKVPGRLRSIGPSSKYDLSALIALANLWAEDDFSADSRALNVFSEAQKDKLAKMVPAFQRDADMLANAASKKD